MVILHSQHSICFRLFNYPLHSYISSKSDTGLVEYYLNGGSPGFQNESLYYSTFLDGCIYVTTSENGHVYKVSAKENRIVHDHGSVGYDLYYDLKQTGHLVNAGLYFYGFVYPNAHLFYFNLGAD